VFPTQEKEMEVASYIMLGLFALWAIIWFINEALYRIRIWGKQFEDILKVATWETRTYLSANPLTRANEEKILRRIRRRWRVSEERAAQILRDAMSSNKRIF
jgi:hypothetical protein